MENADVCKLAVLVVSMGLVLAGMHTSNMRQLPFSVVFFIHFTPKITKNFVITNIIDSIDLHKQKIAVDDSRLKKYYWYV